MLAETKENNHFRQVLNLFKVFRIFKRGIERIPLTLLPNYNILYKDYTSVNIYEQYSENLGKNSQILNKYKLNKVLIEEISDKIDTIISAFTNYQKVINILASSLAEKINALIGNEYQIYITNKIILRIARTNYIIIFRQYLNIISSLLQNNTYYMAEFP